MATGGGWGSNGCAAAVECLQTFAWSTVALLANATHLATRLFQIPLIVNQVSTIVLAVVVLVAAFLMTRLGKDYVFPLVIVWAIVGVSNRLAEVDPVVSVALLVLSAVMIVAAYLPEMLSASVPKRDRAA